LGQYRDSTRVQAHTRAFLVLSHAEIESYLEGWAKDVAQAAEVVWTSSGRVTLPLVFLLTTLGAKVQVPATLQGSNSKDMPQRLADASVKMFQEYYTLIKNNHGVKEKNVLNLFGPLGVPSTALGSTLLPNLDSIGELRGTHAHHSAKVVKTVLDPETEFNRVEKLVNELVVLDRWLIAYRRTAR
jgi:hypothetical protein